MTTYQKTISDFLQKQYPHPEEVELLSITCMNFKIIPCASQPLLQKYSNVRSLILTLCDLRNLQFFPKLPNLIELDLSNNSLQGTLNYLMPCSQLSYLNIANNLIHDYQKLAPLRRFKSLQVCLKENPFILKESSWKNKIKYYNLNIVKQPRKITKQQPPQLAKLQNDKPKEEPFNDSLKKVPNQNMQNIMNFGMYRPSNTGFIINMSDNINNNRRPNRPIRMNRNEQYIFQQALQQNQINSDSDIQLEESEELSDNQAQQDDELSDSDDDKQEEDFQNFNGNFNEDEDMIELLRMDGIDGIDDIDGVDDSGAIQSDSQNNQL